MKQLILHLNETRNFLIQDLDETHLLVDEKHLDYIKEQVHEILERNVYKEKDKK